ncbi:MAG: YhdP family protein [Thiohalomonadales bacterium]
MKTTNKLTFLQRSRILLWYSIVTTLVVTAISMTLARSLISNVTDFRDQLEVFVKKYIEQPLHIETFDAKIIGITPTFIFKGVSLFEPESDKVMARFKEARVGLSIFESIKLQKLIPKSIVISGINLVVTQNKNNTFKIKGIDVAKFDPAKDLDSEESSELSNWLFKQDKLKLENSTIHWINSKTNKVLTFSNINLQLKNSGNRHTLSGDWALKNKIAKRFKIEFDMLGDILNPASWEGRAYVKGEEVNISEIGIPSNLIPLKPTSGIYNFEIWSNFRLGQLKEVTGVTSVRNLKFNPSKHNKIINIDKMGAVWRWDNLADGWALNVDNFKYEVNNKIWPLSRALIESHDRFQPDSIMDIYFDKIDIEDASHLIQKLNLIKKNNIKKLQKMNPYGQLLDTHIRFKVGEILSDDFIFQSDFSNIKFNPDKYIPGVENLSGRIATTNTYGSLVIASNNTIVNFPEIFRDKLNISKFDGRLNWRNVYNEWHVTGNNLIASNKDIETNSNLNIIFPDNKKSPFIDLQTNFKNGDIAGSGKYFPVSIMDKELVNWLDSSLVSGFVTKGGVILQGRLNDFPYLNHNGKFEVSFESENFVLNYLDNWPRIYNASANIKFTGAGFNIDILKAKTLHSDVKSTKIFIKDYTKSELVIKGKVDSTTNNLFKYLVHSPIASDIGPVIEEFKITGYSKINIQINVPLSDEMKKDHSLYYKGSVVTENSAISLYKNIFEFNHINGEIKFDENGFKSNNLNAISFNEPSKINIYSIKKDTIFSHHILAQGKLSSDTIQNTFNIPWMEKSSGVANWQGIFNFGYSSEDTEIPASIVFTTDLQGINLTIPTPLKKNKTDKIPISIESKFISKNKNQINISINDTLSISSTIKQFNDKYKLNSAIIKFDIENNSKLQDGTILVQGNIHDINIDSWSSFVNDFQIDKELENDTFITPELKVVFDVNSFHIPDSKVKSTDPDIEKEKNDKTKYKGFDPRKVPEFSGEIRDIFYDDAKIGTLSFDFKHSINGFDIKKLNLHSDKFELDCSGIWHIFPDKNKDRYLTKFTNVKFISSDLGATLSSLGFKSVLNKGKSNSDMTIWWYDSPLQFSINKLSAEIFVNVSDGELLDIDPKAGRLLGLLSISNLPRRLIGDFSDVFGKGLVFDSIIGKVRIANGILSTKELLMSSSAAKIYIYGNTDLVNHKFDQKIKVIPNITDTTAAILGGIFGSLPGVIIAKILGDIIGLDKADTRIYQISGTWEKPIIESVTKPKSKVGDIIESTFDDEDSGD